MTDCANVEVAKARRRWQEECDDKDAARVRGGRGAGMTDRIRWLLIQLVAVGIGLGVGLWLVH